MNEKLYVLDTIHGSDVRQYAGGQWINDTRQRCPYCHSLVELTEPADIQIALDHLGRRGFAEYLWNSHSLPIFRQDIVQLWNKERLTGFDLEPVTIVGWNNRPKKSLPGQVPLYYFVHITGMISLLEPRPIGSKCPQCGFEKYAFSNPAKPLPHGLRIDPSSWNGLDFSALVGYNLVFCSLRASQIILKAGVNKYVGLVRLENWGTWESPNVKEWTPESYHKDINSFVIRASEEL